MILPFLVFQFALASHSALATTPQVGDMVLFDTTLLSEGHSSFGSLQLELIQQDFNGKFLERQTIGIPGRSPQVKEDWKNATDFIDDDSINKTLANCESYNGKRQSILVPAGSFDSCALPVDNDSNSGTIWVARVPLGIIRTESVSKADGTQMTMALRDYH
jgi:hypothetical protein